MLAAEPPITHRIHLPKPGNRRPLQPKNIPSDPPIKYSSKPGKYHHAPTSNKENINNPLFPVPIDAMDASLAEELTAVRRKLDRMRIDREKTEKTLQERKRALYFAMIELEQRGEFQKELEIEVDRLYRLNQLKIASMRRSPILSLREREMEKKNKEAQSKGAKARESMEGSVDQTSSTESTPPLSFKSTSASTSASTSNSKSTSSSSTKSPVPLRWSLENVSDK